MPTNKQTEFLLDAGVALNERLKGELQLLVDERNEANVLARTLKSRLDHTTNAYRELEAYADKLKAAETQYHQEIEDAKQKAAANIDAAHKRADAMEEVALGLERALEQMHRLCDELNRLDCKHRGQARTPSLTALRIATVAKASYLARYIREGEQRSA